MKLLKDKSYNFEPFHTTLQYISRDGADNSYNYSLLAGQNENNSAGAVEKYTYVLQILTGFEKQTSESISVDVISSSLKTALKRLIPLKDASLFFFDEQQPGIIPADSNADEEFTALINHVYKEGILDWVFDTGKPNIIPEVNNFTAEGARLNYIIYPIFEERKRKGLLAILSPVARMDFREVENQGIQLLLGIALGRIEKLQLKEKLNSTYNEMQTYQAKLSNDFRLSAIGELTEGIAEDIKSPLQVILSYTDMLSRDESDQRAADIVKEQVKKINFVINRLVKFSSLNEDKIKIQPCGLNSIINEYYNLVKSSLESAGIECVLDFERDIPSILSHPSYIFQLLSNIIGIIKSDSENGGGIIIQTRYVAESLMLKFISTVHIPSYNMDSAAGDESRQGNLNFRIIESIIRLHEGEFRIDSFQKNSSVIMLRFPLRRKIRR